MRNCNCYEARRIGRDRATLNWEVKEGSYAEVNFHYGLNNRGLGGKGSGREMSWDKAPRWAQAGHPWGPVRRLWKWVCWGEW